MSLIFALTSVLSLLRAASHPNKTDLLAQPLRTYSKPGDIYIKPCIFDSTFFPLNCHPKSWITCDDAYTYTWSIDYKHELRALSRVEKLKLTLSTGYCPLKRCQLGNVSQTAPDLCPPGLCFTRVENGSPSFGGCCFDNGSFVSGQLIGFVDKSQPIAKPIYAHSRVALRPFESLGEVKEIDNRIIESRVKSGSASMSSNYNYNAVYSSFVNANEVYPGVIATQCPLSLLTPGGHRDTTQDVLHMIVQKRVKLWIQLSPSIERNFQNKTLQLSFRDYYKDNLQGGKCGLFSIDHYLNSSTAASCAGEHHFSISDIEFADGFDPVNQSLTNMPQPYLNHSFHVKSCQDSKLSCAVNESLTSKVIHLWYPGWNDFLVPPHEDDEAIRRLMQAAVMAMQSGGSVVVSCKSGRGRTGTFIAMAIASLQRASSLTQLVDIVVRIREKRDGLLELPSHFRYAAAILGLHEDTSLCNVWCHIRLIVIDTWDSLKYMECSELTQLAAFLAGVLSVLVSNKILRCIGQ